MKLFIACILITILTACAAPAHQDMSKSNIKTSDNGKVITIDPGQSPNFQPSEQEKAPSAVAAQMISPIVH